MKTALITMLCIAIFLCGIVFVQDDMHRQIAALQEMSCRVYDHLAADDFDSAKASSLQLVKQWNEKREYFEIFIDHATLDAAENTLYELHGQILAQADAVHWMGGLSMLQAQFVQIDMHTRMSWGHLL